MKDQQFQDGVFQQPCAYCGAFPALPIVWTYEDGSEYVIYLCIECDNGKIKAIGYDDT
jgi:hypothetical protein